MHLSELSLNIPQILKCRQKYSAWEQDVSQAVLLLPLPKSCHSQPSVKLYSLLLTVFLTCDIHFSFTFCSSLGWAAVIKSWLRNKLPLWGASRQEQSVNPPPVDSCDHTGAWSAKRGGGRKDLLLHNQRVLRRHRHDTVSVSLLLTQGWTETENEL